MRRIFVPRRNLSEAAAQEHHRGRLAGAIPVQLKPIYLIIRVASSLSEHEHDAQTC